MKSMLSQTNFRFRVATWHVVYYKSVHLSKKLQKIMRDTRFELSFPFWIQAFVDSSLYVRGPLHFAYLLARTEDRITCHILRKV